MVPPLIQRHCEHAGIISKKIKRVELIETGDFRLTPTEKFRPFGARETLSGQAPELHWNAKVSRPVLSVYVHDSYENGEGRTQVRLLKWLKVADLSGAEMHEAALQRYLASLVWCPSAFLNDNIRYETVDEKSVKATISDRSVSASGVFRFSPEGFVVGFETRRLRTDGKTSSYDRWTTFCSRYCEFDGIRIPAHGGAIWNLDTGNFLYIRSTVKTAAFELA